MASTKSSEMLSKVRKLVPPLLEKFHKGQHGRVAVLGGSEDYTGAPYFSAMASAKLGCDMSHVICDIGAGTVIKSYSPNLMVHPYLVGSGHLQQFSSSSTSRASEASDESSRKDDLAQAVCTRISETLLPRLHVVILGPGLSRDPPLLAQAALVLQAVREKAIPVVIDADGLGLVIEKPERVKGWGECILTPNVMEFERICKAMNVKVKDDNREERVKALAKALDGPVVLAKGQTDIIAAPRGIQMITCDWEGGLKRSGGQGDTLTGSLGTLLAWRKGYLDGLWGEDKNEKLSPEETMLLCAFAGSAITRECSRLAYAEKGRSMQAGDLTEKVHEAFMNVVGVDSKL